MRVNKKINKINILFLTYHYYYFYHFIFKLIIYLYIFVAIYKCTQICPQPTSKSSKSSISLFLLCFSIFISPKSGNHSPKVVFHCQNKKNSPQCQHWGLSQQFTDYLLSKKFAESCTRFCQCFLLFKFTFFYLHIFINDFVHLTIHQFVFFIDHIVRLIIKPRNYTFYL